MRRMSWQGSRRWSWTASRPARATWFALGLGVLGLLVALTLLISSLSVIGSGEGVTAGALQVPVARIVIVVAVGYLVALGLLAATLVARSPVGGWVLALVAVAIAVSVSVYPLFATAATAVDQARDVVPWILDLIRTVTG